MHGTITKRDYQIRELKAEHVLDYARETGSHTCFVQFMNGFPNIFDFATLEAGGAELDETSSPLQKLIFCTMMISGRLIFPPSSTPGQLNPMGDILYKSQFHTKDMCLCYSGEQCPDWTLMNPNSINKETFLKQVMTNLQTRINELDAADQVQINRVFNVYDGRAQLLGEKSFNQAFQELFSMMHNMWALIGQPDSPEIQEQIQTLYKEYRHRAQVLFNLCMVEARNITWVKKIESVALNNPEVLLLIVPCGAEHFEGMIREILTNPNLRISNLSQSYIDITKSSFSMGKQSAQAKDVALTPIEKKKLKDEGALSATAHITAANANYSQGLLAPGQRSQEPESSEPTKPYTRIGGKKKTRRKRKTKRKRKRKTRKSRNPLYFISLFGPPTKATFITAQSKRSTKRKIRRRKTKRKRKKKKKKKTKRKTRKRMCKFRK